MKKALSIFTALVILSQLCYSQMNVALNATSQTWGLSAGIEAKGVTATIMMANAYEAANYSHYSFQVGYTHNFTEENSFVLGLQAGVALASKKNVYFYSTDKEYTDYESKALPIITAEAGKNMHTGRLSVIATYLGKRMSYGISMKLIF